MTEQELKGQEFLNYVAENQEKLKNNLRKNITYDETYFDDVFQDTIIKIYNSIVIGGKEIKDYEKYFFIASKWNYVNVDNKEKRIKKMSINIDEYIEKNDIEDVDEWNNTDKKINRLKDILIDKFGQDETELYFDYLQMKSQGGMSYKEYVRITGESFDKVSKTVCKIKSFLRKNKDIKKQLNRE